MKLTGKCLCERVKFTCDGEPMATGHCYCVDCRKSSGTSHCTHIGISASNFQLDGATQSYAKSSDSGSIVHRNFCPNCASPIYSTNEAIPGMVFVRASVLDDLDAIKPEMIVFRTRAPKWATHDPELAAFDTMPQNMGH
jgi:hypothetical protein